MIATPAALTKSCASREPELVISAKWPTTDRKTLTQNAASDFWPQVMIGLKICHSSPRQSFGTSRVTTYAMTMKCKTRYGARLVLSLGLKASNSHVGNIFPDPETGVDQCRGIKHDPDRGKLPERDVVIDTGGKGIRRNIAERVVEEMADQIGEQHQPGGETDLPDADAADEFCQLLLGKAGHAIQSNSYRQ